MESKFGSAGTFPRGSFFDKDDDEDEDNEYGIPAKILPTLSVLVLLLVGSPSTNLCGRDEVEDDEEDKDVDCISSNKCHPFDRSKIS